MQQREADRRRRKAKNLSFRKENEEITKKGAKSKDEEKGKKEREDVVHPSSLEEYTGGTARSHKEEGALLFQEELERRGFDKFISTYYF